MSHHQHDWRTYLHRLPEAEPPEALWARIAQARAEARPAPRTNRWLAFAGMAAALALAAVLVTREPPQAPARPAVAALAAPQDSEAVRALDDAIGLAYARNAGQEELDALWQVRERLLGSPAESEPLLARL